MPTKMRGVLLEPLGSRYGIIEFGEQGNTIKAGTATDLNFYTASDFVFWANNVGIGVTNPPERLEVDGTLKSTGIMLTDGNEATGKILQSDVNGLASWVDPMTLTVDDGDWTQNGNNMYSVNSGNVGIGTTAPAYPLDVSGDIRFTGQLYDANGLFKPSPWEKEENNLFYLNGRIGIGTDSLPATLNIGGSIWLNGNLYLDDPEGGLIMRSPNGSCWKLTVSDEGNLTVVPGGCLTNSTPENMLTDEAKEQAVVVFPNPADNEVRIRKVSHGQYFASILNQQGILLQSVELKRKETSIFLSGYKPGIYIFRISDHNSRIVQTEKVVVR